MCGVPPPMAGAPHSIRPSQALEKSMLSRAQKTSQVPLPVGTSEATSEIPDRGRKRRIGRSRRSARAGSVARIQICFNKSMKFGISTFVTDEGIAPGPLAAAIEERGFDSLFVAEHTHIPLSRKSPWPRGGELPRKYYRTLDPFVTLTA